MNRTWRLLIIALTFTSCATPTPKEITQAPEHNLTIIEVQHEPDRFIGTTIRWGGIISKIENKTTQTWIEVISYQLKKGGKPRKDSRTEGRFIASFIGFVDPLVYASGRELTIVGTITGKSIQLIGDYAYTYPIVTVSTSYLWPEEPPPSIYDYPPPWYYDPWPYYHPYRYPYPPYYW